MLIFQDVGSRQHQYRNLQRELISTSFLSTTNLVSGEVLHECHKFSFIFDKQSRSKGSSKSNSLKKKSAFRSFIDRAVLHPVELKKHSKYDQKKTSTSDEKLHLTKLENNLDFGTCWSGTSCHGREEQDQQGRYQCVGTTFARLICQILHLLAPTSVHMYLSARALVVLPPYYFNI